MKKILATLLLVISLNATAWGGWGNRPWNNNGFIAQNPFSTFSLDWFEEEMSDFVDEFDNNNNSWNNNRWNNNRWNNSPWGNGNYQNRPWGNRNFNNMPWGNNTLWNNGYYNNRQSNR